MAYLDQFDLEKEDVLQLSAGWNQMNKVPMVLRAMDRVFGSGKNSAINLLRIVAENLYYVITRVSVADATMIMDTLSMMITEIGEYADAVHVLDQLLLLADMSVADAAVVSDLLLSIWEIRRELVESIIATEYVHTDMTTEQRDSVVMGDLPEFWSVYGFGSGGFGEVQFGGLSAWRQKSPDEIIMVERLLTALTSLRSASITLDDSLLIGSGFGGKLSSGFGAFPFGG
jgi:hypothetical protein